MNYLFAKSSLDFGKYGDFTFTGNGLKKLKTSEEVIYQNIYKFIKSNVLDYELSPYYAADLQVHIGRGLDLSVSTDIEKRLRDDIIRQGLIPDQYIDVYSLIDVNTLHLRVILFDSEEYTISMEINNSGVVLS